MNKSFNNYKFAYNKDKVKYIETNEYGITLIALVVTIIVLLILAGITIGAITGDNGIIKQAQNAADSTERAQWEERIDQAIIDTENKHRNPEMSDVIEELYKDGIITEDAKNEDEELNKKGIITTVDGTRIEGKLDDYIPFGTGVIAEKEETYKDTNGDIAIIPSGFKILEEAATVDDGLVIQDAQLNEFVWVPVDFTEFKREHFGAQEQKWWTGTFVTDKISEKNMYEPTANGETNGTEVEQMYKSVKDNGGFYIGRYEAGKDKTDETKAVSQKGVEVYNNIKWGNSMTEENGGAVEKARNFDTQSGHTNITSTLVYGVQWDAVMRWISKDNNLKAYLTDSSGIGNYSEILNSTTGANDTYQMKNIYDLAGNVSEWTMEAHSTSNRVDRGGGYDFLSDGSPCSFRNGSSWDSSAPDLGFRIAFFL